MIDFNFQILTVSLTALFEYGCVLAADKQKPKAWKIGLLVGVACSGFAAFGFARPELDPWSYLGLNSWMTFGLGTLYMMGSVFYDYYRKVPFNTELELEKRKSILRELGIGLVFILFMTVIIGFMQGQNSIVKVNRQASLKVDTLTSIVTAMYFNVGSLSSKVDRMDKQVQTNGAEMVLLKQQRKLDSMQRMDRTRQLSKGINRIIAAQKASKKQDKLTADKAEALQPKPEPLKPATIPPRKKVWGIF